MAQNIQRFNIYGKEDVCKNGSLCYWEDVEPYIKEQNLNSLQQLKDSISDLKKVRDGANNLGISYNQTLVRGMNAVIAKLESI